MPDYIPSGDAEFDTYQQSFITYAAANTVAIGLVPGNITSLTTAQTAWAAAYTAHNAAVAAALAARSTKDLARQDLQDTIRVMAKKVQATTTVTDAQRFALGITVADTIASPVGAPVSRPVVSADTSQRLEITLDWRDIATPTSKAKPVGTIGAEIYMKLDGPAPMSIQDCDFVALDTKAPYKVAFEGGDGGKTAYFMLRWVNTKGEPGPISETVAATVPG
jgi:hypothetical protein